VTRNKTYEESPTRGTSKYRQKEVGDLIKDRASGEMIIVIDRCLDEIGVSTHCLVQYVGDTGSEKLATWFVDYECEKI
jgi:hypothetical protein